MKHIIITGGVTSSLGKGITAASIGRLLKLRGFSVMLQKFDPYLNANPGLLSPRQHGEVFVTDDGTEADLDLGHYERFVDINLDKTSSVTTGKIYQTILENEKNGVYKGSTIQVIPHVTDEIKKHFYRSGKNKPDILITEIGGTVGDIEGLPFLEAARQLKREMYNGDIAFVHVTYLPILDINKEVKTKPTQHSVKTLKSIGIQPDILVCRTDRYGFITDEVINKISLFCDVKINNIVENYNVETVYELPKILHAHKLDEMILRTLQLPCNDINLFGFWLDIGLNVRLNKQLTQGTIGIVCQHFKCPDAYLSVTEALKHAMISNKQNIEIELVNAKEIKESGRYLLENYDGIVIIDDVINNEDDFDAMISTVTWAKQNKIPIFGICVGAQAMMAEELISNEKITYKKHNEIALYNEFGNFTDEKGFMKLGSFSSSLLEGSKLKDIYGKSEIKERHRHLFELNMKYIGVALLNGELSISAWDTNRETIDAIERKDHPFFIGCMFNPEFKSRPDKPHPLFVSFISAVKERVSNNHVILRI